LASGTVFYRHSLVVRITHWINVLCFLLLLMSGLQIFNAHPALYWGNASRFDDPWLAMNGYSDNGQPTGVTAIAGYEVKTTGLLGASRNSAGRYEARGFPSWATIPSYRDLATGRRWHFFFAWLFVLNGLVYLISSLLGGHAWRDLLPSRLELARIGASIRDHLRLRFPHRQYNVLQKLSYLAVIFILLPLMIATGLTMSPGIDSGFPWLVEIFGGRQSARSIHFISATLLVLFVIVHLVMVLLSGVVNNLRAMITGYSAIAEEGERHGG
jgi:thiosulfate reductase cytochrome b subunit